MFKLILLLHYGVALFLFTTVISAQEQENPKQMQIIVNEEEAIKLDKKGKEILSNKTVKKAILKLEKSKKIINSLNQKDVEVIKMNNKIDEATRAYKYLIEFLELEKETNNLFIEKCYGQ